MDLDPDDFAIWLQVRLGKKNDSKIPKSSVHMARKASAKATRAARMPSILPKEETMVIVLVNVILAFRTVVNLSLAETALDTYTPDEQRARRYANIKSIVVGNKTYRVGAYAAAPHATVKGVVKGIPLEDLANTINENILNVRNPQARAAQRIGSSTTIIVAFEGPKCTPYRKHCDVCRTCGKVGQRMDVCPTTEAKTCKDCGKAAVQNHQCNPKCNLCGGPHLTGDGTCSNRFKTPYVIKCRQWKKKTKIAAPKDKEGNVPAKTEGNSPQLRRPRSRGSSRTRSRSRSRSVGGTVTWAQKAQPESEEMKSLKEANKQQARKLAEQENIIKKMAADMAAMKQKMTQLSTKQQPETAATDEETRSPPTKRRSTETSGPQRGPVHPDRGRRTTGHNSERNSGPTMAATLKIWVWNCNGFQTKKTTIQHAEELKIPCYTLHLPSRSDGGYKRGICTFVRRGITVLTHDYGGDNNIERLNTELVIGKESIYLVNVYNRPKFGRQRFKTLVYKSTQLAEERTLVISGNFNAPHTDTRHGKTTVKGRNLLQDTTEADLILITDPSQPTRLAQRATDRDTTPDLAFKNEEEVTWRNTQEDLGSDHKIELQEAIQVIEDALEGAGLKCSPSKSELLAINPRSPRWDNIKLVTKYGPIPRVDWIKILGMTIERTRRNGVTVAKLDHVTHVASYLKWQSIEKRKLNALICKVYKNALGLLHNTNTEKLKALGMHNTVEEIIEAQKTSQQQRLEQTRSGRTLLERLNIPTRREEAKEEAIRPEDIQGLNGRRRARAQALYRIYERDTGAVYVDAARQGDRCAAVVTRAADWKLLTSASVKTGSIRTAEEVAIAHAASLPTTTSVLSDSKQALRNFAEGRVSRQARGILRPNNKIDLIWCPAHEEGNVTADETARALMERADLSTALYEAQEFGEILRNFRKERQELPEPHSNLTREEAVVFRQLQTEHMVTPVMGKHIMPEVYKDDTCKLCKSTRATLYHIAWNCTRRPTEASQEKCLPP
ncbi:hypothetical protein HPB47_003089 [Ixodes persulcatus]|uniref:Uncharacterized protein n=1 Tax=Ixodes persulcatus TaxID=34615 RepID=A0AC60PJE0_IXOPE|nr:hypothetical protein HPB47_003089 [Ixodes persulcatus]